MDHHMTPGLRTHKLEAVMERHRIGDDIIYRYPPRNYRDMWTRSVRFRVVALSPLEGVPVEVIHTRWIGDEIIEKRRRFPCSPA